VAQVLDRMLSASLSFVLSPALLAEYRSVMLRPKITGRLGLLADEVAIILTDIARHAASSSPDHPRPTTQRRRTRATRCGGVCWHCGPTWCW